MGGFRRDTDGVRRPVEIPSHAIGVSHSDGRYSRGCVTSRRATGMPGFEMTGAEIRTYGENISIWKKLMLIQAWAPLFTFAQRFIGTPDPYAKSLVVSECCEWLASKTDSGLDDELVKHLAAILRTTEGENLVRWVLAKAEDYRA